MIDKSILDNQVPIGFSDLFLDEAARQLWLIRTLREVFTRWGYAPIIPPTVAYAEGLSANAGSGVYRFFDREGHTLALRTDLTLPVARIVGTRLYDQPLPLRLCYVERVFRHVAPQAGQRREFTQAGVELIGADTAQADAEVIALAADALRAMGIRDFRLALGQMAYFRALLSELELSKVQVDRLKGAIDRRNDAHLLDVLQEIHLPKSMVTLLRALPTLTGGQETIDQARKLTSVPSAQHALDRLAAVLEILDAYGLGDLVIVDLGEVRSMDYYTGLVFQGYAAGVGSALCSGGRYNDLIGRFGPDLPAVGFGLDVELGRLATEPAVDIRPDAIVQGCAHAACYDAVCQMRARGLRTIVDTLGRSGEALTAYAHARGARAIRCLRPGQWEVVDQNHSRRHIDTQQIGREVDTW